jgi:hypothetical protein
VASSDHSSANPLTTEFCLFLTCPCSVSGQALEVIRKLKEVMPIKRTKMLLRIHFAARGKPCVVSVLCCVTGRP